MNVVPMFTDVNKKMGKMLFIAGVALILFMNGAFSWGFSQTTTFFYNQEKLLVTLVVGYLLSTGTSLVQIAGISSGSWTDKSTFSKYLTFLAWASILPEVLIASYPQIVKAVQGNPSGSGLTFTVGVILLVYFATSFLPEKFLSLGTEGMMARKDVITFRTILAYISKIYAYPILIINGVIMAVGLSAKIGSDNPLFAGTLFTLAVGTNIAQGIGLAGLLSGNRTDTKNLIWVVGTLVVEIAFYLYALLGETQVFNINTFALLMDAIVLSVLPDALLKFGYVYGTNKFEVFKKRVSELFGASDFNVFTQL